MKERIVSDIQSTNALWVEIKKDWFGLGLPGFASSPTEMLVRLLLIKLGINSAAELKQVLSSISDEDIKELNQARLVPGYWLTSDASSVFLLKLILSEKDGGNVSRSIQHIVEQPLAHLEASPSEIDVSVEPVVDEVLKTDQVVETKKVTKETSQTDEEDISVSDEPSVGCIHVDHEGNCSDCSKEDFFDCISCDESISNSKLTDCATNGDDCTNTYCPDCVEENINKHGFCPDCKTVDCEVCSNEVINGEQIQCASENSKCDYVDLCDGCAARYLNDNKECPTCSGEEVVACSICPSGDDEFIGSKITYCVNVDECDNGYCAEHAPDNLNAQGKCSNCTEQEEAET